MSSGQPVREPSARDRGSHVPEILVLLASVAVSFGYSAYTDHIWEDFFITFRHSENLAAGKGLVFQEGERVHGFTSPLGVLLPALCHLATGLRSYHAAIWAFRALSIAALAGSVLILLARCRREREGRRSLLWWALAAFLVLEVKSVGFSVNGMETGFLLLFLASAVALTASDRSGRWLPLGLAWAGLMWSRPDGCIPIAALCLGDLAFGPGPRKERFGVLLRAGAVTTAAYLPWILWAWAYYGTPIPHTIIAKRHLADASVSTLGPLLRYFDAGARVFLPIYHNLQDGVGWPRWLPAFCGACSAFAAGYWIVPVRDPWGRSCSLAYAAMVAYFACLNYAFPWYAPPALVLGLIALASGLPETFGLVARATRLGFIRHLAAVPLAAIGLVMLGTFALTTYEMRVQADVVEMGNRAKVGRWLRAHAKPGEVVYLECVGYIGYFSGARMADWPGLVTPSVVRIAREHGADFYSIVPLLKPDWIVLRPWEAGKMAERIPSFGDDYERVADFNAFPAMRLHFLPAWARPLAGGAPLPGIGYLSYDAHFVIYRRKAPTTGPQ